VTIVELLLTALGSAGVSAVIVKWLHRGVDKATEAKVRAEARAIAADAATHEVNLLRTMLDDFRTDQARKDAVIEGLESRIDKLEERERHMLTRAAVHEAWDQLAFQFIAGHDASFPSPPPLYPHTAQPAAITQAAETNEEG
jgi:hypothetical protein